MIQEEDLGKKLLEMVKKLDGDFSTNLKKIEEGGTLPGDVFGDYLDEFIEQGLIKKIEAGDVVEVPSIDYGKEFPIPLSQASREIEEKLSKKVRTLTAYNEKFLEAYQPNQTYYLNASTRKNLFEMGSSTQSNQEPGTHLRTILDRFFVDVSSNSLRLDNFTVAPLAINGLLKCVFPAEEEIYYQNRLLNYKEALSFLIETPKIERTTILKLHGILSKGLLGNSLFEGSFRLTEAPQSKPSAYRPLDDPFLIRKHFIQLINLAKKIKDPFEQAFFLIVHISYLQPFEGYNENISRLAANIPLINKNISPLSFVDVPEKTYDTALLAIWELNQVDLMRDVFIWGYERSCYLYATEQKSLKTPDPFRSKYQEKITSVIKQIVQEKMDREKAFDFLLLHPEIVPSDDLWKFMEVVQTELINLHQGNCQKYEIHLNEYTLWRFVWDAF